MSVKHVDFTKYFLQVCILLGYLTGYLIYDHLFAVFCFTQRTGHTVTVIEEKLQIQVTVRDHHLKIHIIAFPVPAQQTT
jgi:hypothetical protein